MPHVLQRLLKILRLTQDERYRGYWIALVMLLLLGYGAGGIYYFEHGTNDSVATPGDALWWAIVTMTTVGYGDLFPTTAGGRWLVAVPTMLLGIGILGYAIGLVTSYVLERHNKEISGMLPFTGEGHIIICHCPSSEVVLEVVDEIRADATWSDRGVVMVTDRFEHLPEELRKAKIHFVAGEPSREVVLDQAGIEQAHSVMILASTPGSPASDNQTLGVVVTARTLNPRIYIVAECISRENTSLLANAGADEVVGLGTLTAGLMVQGLQDPGINAVLSELVSNRTGHQIYIEKLSSFRGTFRELQDDLARRGHYALLGIIDGDERKFLPDPTTAIAPGQRVVMLGDVRPDGL